MFKSLSTLTKMLSLSAFLAVFLVLPASSYAAGSVAVSVGQTDVQAPDSGSVIQTYNYNLTFDSVPDHATIDIVGPNGGLAMPTISRDLHGANSPVSGSGEVAVTKDLPAGYYTVRVAYYATGSDKWEARASKVFRVIAPKPAVVIPDPPVTTTTTPTVTTPVVDPPPVFVDPQATADKPQLSLRKRAVNRTVRAGHNAPFILVVKNTGKITVRNVRVCDRLPQHTTVVKLGGGKLSAGSVCWTVAALPVGKSITVKTTLRVDATASVKRIVNRATAAATNVALLRAQATVLVAKAAAPNRRAPVTG